MIEIATATRENFQEAILALRKINQCLLAIAEDMAITTEYPADQLIQPLRQAFFKFVSMEERKEITLETMKELIDCFQLSVAQMEKNIIESQDEIKEALTKKIIISLVADNLQETADRQNQ